MVQEQKLPIVGFWIEDWVGHRNTLAGKRLWWNWVVNRELYPNWENLITKLRDQSVRVLIYFNPYLSDTSNTEIERNLYQEALDLDFFILEPKGRPFAVKAGLFEGNIIDLTNPEARHWLKRFMMEQLQLGVAGWMADFGEAVPYDGIMKSGVEGRSYHNQFPLDWSKLTSEAIRDAGLEGEAFSFHRSGNLKSPSYNSMFWTGDQLASWDAHDGIKSVIPALTSSGMSGWALSHSDIGGFLSIDILYLKYKRSKELFLRWLELNTFTALLRTHATNQPQGNHQWNSDPETIQLFKKFATLYRAMKDYRLVLMKEAYKNGLPLVRHPMLHYPDDPKTHDIDQQFMLGPDFWIAPVLDPGKKDLMVYLPKGEWVHLWSQKVFDSEGSWYRVHAPIGEPAVFFQKSSVYGIQLSQRLRKEGLLDP
jgi:alpha-glucosidase